MKDARQAPEGPSKAHSIVDAGVLSSANIRIYMQNREGGSMVGDSIRVRVRGFIFLRKYMDEDTFPA